MLISFVFQQLDKNYSKNMESKSCIELPLPEDEVKNVIEKAKDWAIMHGNYLFSVFYFSLTSLEKMRELEGMDAKRRNHFVFLKN